MDIRYAIKRGGKFLQSVEPNKHYQPNAISPTMGRCHTNAEYRTVWGKEQAAFERLTAAEYMKILMEEYRWEDKDVMDFRVIPLVNEAVKMRPL